MKKTRGLYRYKGYFAFSIAAAVAQGPGILDHARVHKHSVLHPATWLSQGRWMDEPETVAPISECASAGIGRNDTPADDRPIDWEADRELKRRLGFPAPEAEPAIEHEIANPSEVGYYGKEPEPTTTKARSA